MTFPKGFKKPTTPPPYQPQYHTRSGKAIAILIVALMVLTVLFTAGGALLVFVAWVEAPQPIMNRNGIIALVIALLMFIVSSWILIRRYGGEEEKKKEGAEERPSPSHPPIPTMSPVPPPTPRGNNNNNNNPAPAPAAGDS